MILGPYAALIKWGGIALLAITLMGSGAYLMHEHDVKKYNALSLKFETFKIQTATLGEDAKRKAQAKEAEDKQKKDKADAENQRTHSELALAGKRLRDSRASSSFLPQPTPGSRSPETVTFNRTDLERAIQQLDTEVSQLLTEADNSRADLNTAKQWAQ